MLAVFTHLLKTKPQASFQFRINYTLSDAIEVALKYTETWGFHIEVERTYTATTGEEKRHQEKLCQQKLAAFSEYLGVHYITDKEMKDFAKQCKQGGKRGLYTSSEFEERYGGAFDL